MSAKQIENRIQIWSDLDGRRIVLTGLNHEQRQVYAQNLVHIASQKGIDLTVSEEFADVTEQDLVLVFAEIKGNQEKNSDEAETDALKKLMQDLQMLAEKKPAAALLISDYLVYGKQFGTKDSLRENELGYIAHTAKEGIRIQYMRMAEHLACRLAREERFHIRIARQSLRKETENLEQMMEAVIQVLLYGQDGEIYNLPPSGSPLVLEPEETAEKTVSGIQSVLLQNNRSPLSPAETVPDTGKIEHILSGGR